MKTRQLMIVEPGRVELQEIELDEKLRPNEALVKAEYSIVSAGTEGACFTGLIREMPFQEAKTLYPCATGYGHLGSVLAVGSEVKMCKPGDRVLSFARHGSFAKANAVQMALPVSNETDGKKLVYARMAGVSIASIRSSSIQPGDTVLVIGMGLVGNFAAQLFQLAGADVMAVDLSDLRLKKARESGLKRTVNSGKQDLKQIVMDWTGGKGAQIVVEAIGVSEIINQAVLLTRRFGEVILLGSPRASAKFDVTPMLLHIHISAIRMIGAFEWCWPMHETPRARNLMDNYRQIAEWITEDRLKVEPLLTHLASPADCQIIYEGLTCKKEEFLSAVFDWNCIG